MDLKIANHQLAKLLATPAMAAQADIAMLTDLIEAFPFYKTLHLLLAKATENTENQPQTFSKAALYNGGDLLYQVVYTPEKFAAKYLSPQSSPEAEIAKEPENSFAQSLAIGEAEEEVFEEIVEVNPLNFATKEANIPEKLTTDDLALESIVATDFFAFEKELDGQIIATETPKQAVPMVEEYDQEAEAQTISKYNDEKLPYSFLWWLAKTRKEHEQIFQPYVSRKSTPTPTPANANELQQQYVEHIFHLQTPFNIAEEAKKPSNGQLALKGNKIIDNFIQNEPQIKPPKPEQINNENKAKKSAEDHNDLVSETLASIYIEQMLYQKAIEIYEKLSLKFPEKSRYFANLIKSLEKKI